MKHTIKTDIGVVRSENQDSAAVFEKNGVTFAILCDGMGGHTGGSTASKTTIATFEKEFNRSFPTKNGSMQTWFKKTIKKCSKEMVRAAGDDVKMLDMGTTVTAAAISDDFIVVFNIGDSRTYIYNGLLHKITTDHNLRNFYIDNHGYSEERAATISGATALTSALGPNKKSKLLDVISVTRDGNEKYVILTSDGIHDYIGNHVFEKILTDNDDISIMADELIIKALRGKSADNLTTVIVEVK